MSEIDGTAFDRARGEAFGTHATGAERVLEYVRAW